MVGEKMYDLVKELFPINRSLSGEGVRETLNILKRENKELKQKDYKNYILKMFNGEIMEVVIDLPQNIKLH